VAEQSLVQGIVDRFRDKHTITVATGVTCAFLGDERTLREHLLAGEVVRVLRDNGHIVHHLCFDDDLDPLTFRQLRVAVDKEPDLVSHFEPHCGKPVCNIRAPFSADMSWSRYFEGRFLERLNRLGCNPNLISVSQMYERGLYAPYVKQVLVQEDGIREYLRASFPNYRPDKLFWAVCPVCGYIDGTATRSSEVGVEVSCERCLSTTFVRYAELRGKLNWKLDCAARWSMFSVDAEPFSKEYLEPSTGTFFVAQGLSKTFFGGNEVVPIQYGSVFMPTSLSGSIMECLPANVVRNLFLQHPRADLEISEERIVTEANKVEVLPELTFAALVKQILPVWLLDSTSLTSDQRELMSKGLAYAKRFEHREVKAQLPNRSHLDDIPCDVLGQIQGIIRQVILMREAFGMDYDAFVGPAKAAIQRLGDQRKQVTSHFRKIIGQEQGVPNSRFLFLLPVSYLKNLDSLIGLYLSAAGSTNESAVVELASEQRPIRMAIGDSYAVGN